MRGDVTERLGIIPPNVSWGAQAGTVFQALAGDFMKDSIAAVDVVLGKGTMQSFNDYLSSASTLHSVCLAISPSSVRGLELIKIWIIAGLPVSLYNGQLDLICSTLGLDAWVPKLKWEGLASFQAAEPKPLYTDHNHGKRTTGFKRQHDNLALYIILNAGHMIPADQPEVALDLVRRILYPLSDSLY